MEEDQITFVAGIGDGKTTACLMSYRSLLDGRPFGDGHPSSVLRACGIALDDGPWWSSDAERTAVLMPLALDERLSASHCDASPEAERKRAEMCAHWALSVAAPMALESAAARLRPRYPELAESLGDHAAKLRAEPTADNGRDARAAARAAATKATARDDAAAARDAAWAADDATRASSHADAAAFRAESRGFGTHAAANATFAAEAAHRAGADIRPELIALFERLLDVRGGAS